jgi:hypothetical protein
MEWDDVLDVIILVGVTVFIYFAVRGATPGKGGDEG